LGNLIINDFLTKIIMLSHFLIDSKKMTQNGLRRFYAQKQLKIPDFL
jgi:hypothetical protein